MENGLWALSTQVAFFVLALASESFLTNFCFLHRFLDTDHDILLLPSRSSPHLHVITSMQDLEPILQVASEPTVGRILREAETLYSQVRI
jgi:hypothetical protein